jgi:hypothetical protein
MAVPQHLTIKIDHLSFDSLFSDWRWLVSPEFTPVLMTAFGDVFLCDASGAIHFLDSKSGTFEKVADSQGAFEMLCEAPVHQHGWFADFLLAELRKAHGELAIGECYSCKTPLSLGGTLEVDNFERMDLEVHLSILGQIHQQTRHLPPGVTINSVRIEEHSEEPRKTSWLRRLLG